uniref:Putative secreted protein n=1 Tax=Ixodes ricinus TaxID=34613 RepID=A0A6B0V656_IXORI
MALPLVGLCSGTSIVFPGVSFWGMSATLSSAAARPRRLDGGARCDGLLGLFFTAVFLARTTLALRAGESLVTFAAFGLPGEVDSFCTAGRLSGGRPLLALGLGAGEPALSTDGLGSAFGAAARDFPRAFFVGDAGLAEIPAVLALLVLRDATLTSFLAGLLPLRAGVAGGVLGTNEGWTMPTPFRSGDGEPLPFFAEALASDPLVLRSGEPWPMPPSFRLVEDEFLPF